VIHARVRADVAGSRDEGFVAGEEIRDEGVVEIVNGRECVEGALGERAFGAGAGRGRRFAGHAADVFHEELRRLHVMNGIVNGERADANVGRIIAAARQH
jgi:hypothetical protein